MSRCFPFPPPGYEKKLIPEVANILKKEKTKEKKHKEKKEGKEKDKSNGKHREKKDKKEKYKDRKKDKEKNKEKDQEKVSTSVEKKGSGEGEEHIRAKVHPSEKLRDEEKKEQSSTSEEKRHIGQFGYCNGEEKLQQKVEKIRERKNTADEKTFAVQLQGHNGGNKSVLHSSADKDSQDAKFMLEFSKRINDEGKGSGSHLVEGFMDMGFKKVERIDKFVVRDSCTVVEGKGKVKDKQVDNCNIDGRWIHHEEKFNGNAMSQNLSGSIQNKIGVSKSKDNSEGKMNGKEKPKERERDDKRVGKRKSKHKDKKSNGRDKNRTKEKRKEDKSKKDRQKSEKDNSRSSNKNAATEGIPKKRKDIEKNGFLPEYVIKPEKMPRLDSHPFSENGQESEPLETTTLFTSQKQGNTNNFKVDSKDNKLNGLTGPHQLPISMVPKPSPVIAELPISTVPKPTPVTAEQIAEALRKPPHPDMKYLSKVLSVPRIDEWSEVDDQAWLFNKKDSLLNKSEVDLVGVNQEQQVWAETLRIESADVFALPYVIPY